MRCPCLIFLLALPLAAAAQNRSSQGLQALYDFSGNGDQVKDRSGRHPALDLKIENASAVRRAGGALEIRGKTLIRSDKPPSRLIDAVKKSNEISVEAWVTAANTNQDGPARLVTLSRDSTNRNFTLGQDGKKWIMRLRTNRTSHNGIPSLDSKGGVDTRLKHLVYTRDRNGRATLYIDGKSAAAGNVPGPLSTWDSGYRLALADELNKGRPWLGSMQLIAIYSRALKPAEVTQHYRLGPKGRSAPFDPKAPGDPLADGRAQFFETRIAPLLSKHCLECHDSAKAKGGLDLAHKTAAFKGGENGKAIVPGKLDQGLLWKSVAADEMPHKRDPLGTQEKELLKQWIQAGAVWTAELIDPAVYNGKTQTGAWVQRLTVPEYINTVKAATGVDIANEARELLPKDLRADGFSNTAYNLNVDLKHVQAYARLAERIVARMDVPAFAARFERSTQLTDKNMKKLVEKMGRWLLRGPLNQREYVSYRGISTTAAAQGGNFEEAVGLIIEAMLQSPRFIYRIEDQSGGRRSADDWELASRMSYILWGAPPDEALIRAAEQGALSDPARLQTELDRMLADERSIRRSAQFLYEWLNLNRLNNLRPDPKHYPNWSPELAADMRNETLSYFLDVVWKQKKPLSALMNSQHTFATPRLAKHYGLKPGGDGRVRYDLTRVPARGGLLTQGSVLTIGGDESSMVARGLFVLTDLLRGVVKDPPPGTDTTPVPPKKGASHRTIAEGRIADRSCGGCHSRFEPLAFGLEKYDGLGVYHEKDRHGNRLREDGEVLFPGASKPITYRSASELMDLLAQSDRIAETLTWKIAQFSLGRPLGAAERLDMAKIHAAAKKNGGTYAAVLRALIMSDLVRMSGSDS